MEKGPNKPEIYHKQKKEESFQLPTSFGTSLSEGIDQASMQSMLQQMKQLETEIAELEALRTDPQTTTLVIGLQEKKQRLAFLKNIIHDISRHTHGTN